VIRRRSRSKPSRPEVAKAVRRVLDKYLLVGLPSYQSKRAEGLE
jgi:hypothetical protein